MEYLSKTLRVFPPPMAMHTFSGTPACTSARAARDRKYVSPDSPELWSWPIFPPGFHSEHSAELARVQADPQARETHRVACPLHKNLCRMSTLDLQEQFPPIHPKQH
jgi:hypothetical protein